MALFLFTRCYQKTRIEDILLKGEVEISNFVQLCTSKPLSLLSTLKHEKYLDVWISLSQSNLCYEQDFYRLKPVCFCLFLSNCSS